MTNFFETITKIKNLMESFENEVIQKNLIDFNEFIFTINYELSIHDVSCLTIKFIIMNIHKNEEEVLLGFIYDGYCETENDNETEIEQLFNEYCDKITEAI